MRKIFAILASVLMITFSSVAMAAPHGGFHGGGAHVNRGFHGGGGHWRGGGWWLPGAIIGGVVTGVVVEGCWRSWYDEFGVYHRVWIC